MVEWLKPLTFLGIIVLLSVVFYFWYSSYSTTYSHTLHMSYLSRFDTVKRQRKLFSPISDLKYKMYYYQIIFLNLWVCHIKYVFALSSKVWEFALIVRTYQNYFVICRWQGLFHTSWVMITFSNKLAATISAGCPLLLVALFITKKKKDFFGFWRSVSIRQRTAECIAEVSQKYSAYNDMIANSSERGKTIPLHCN